jgi:hypothetical protein
LEPTDASSDPASAAPTSTGDVILDRLNALEARVKQLEARNAELEQQAELNQTRLQSVETKAAKAAQFTGRRPFPSRPASSRSSRAVWSRRMAQLSSSARADMIKQWYWLSPRAYRIGGYRLKW